MGKPAVAATGMRANLNSLYGDADDNGIIIARFPDGIATIEGSWTIFHTAINNGPIVYGEKGTLVLADGKVLIFKDRYGAATEYDVEPIASHRDNPAKEFINHLATGEIHNARKDQNGQDDWFCRLTFSISAIVWGYRDNGQLCHCL